GRTRLRREHAGATQHRGAADRRGAATPICHRVRIERQTGLASARGPRAQQGSEGTGPERIHRGAIKPDSALVEGFDMFRKFMVAVPIVVMAIGGSTACATKKFVRTSVGEVNEKVDSQGRAIEETQERTRRNEGRISEVDQKALAAGQSAQAAKDAAAAAHNAATTVGTEANTKFE